MSGSQSEGWELLQHESLHQLKDDVPLLLELEFRHEVVGFGVSSHFSRIWVFVKEYWSFGCRTSLLLSESLSGAELARCWLYRR